MIHWTHDSCKFKQGKHRINNQTLKLTSLWYNKCKTLAQELVELKPTDKQNIKNYNSNEVLKCQKNRVDSTKTC